MGPLVGELAAVLPADLEVIDRSTVNAWDDDRAAAAIPATGQKKVADRRGVHRGVPGVPREVAGIRRLRRDRRFRTFWQAEREAGLLRIQQAGVILVDYASAMVDILADNADPLAAEAYAAMDMPFAVVVGQMAAVYTKNDRP